MRLGLYLLMAGALAVPMLALAKPVTYSLPADEQIVGALKPGEDVELVQAHCAACHSLDYIRTQPPQRGEAYWTATVHKMIAVYGASIEEPDAKAITAYLVKNY